MVTTLLAGVIPVLLRVTNSSIAPGIPAKRPSARVKPA
jgi:hypothetical protein